MVGASLGATRPAEAKSYTGAEVYSLTEVKYGRIEMRMRMIRGSGMVSTFFTYKNGSETAGTAWEELDIEALGKNDGKSWQSNLITGNPRVTSEQLYTSSSSLADAYHTYTLEWTPESVTWFFDGKMMRKTTGGQASKLINPQTLRFNAWISDSTGWAGALDVAALPAYQFVNWIKYYRYEAGQFVLDWTDEFDTLDTTRWGFGNWTFDGNLADFDPDNAVVRDGTLILAINNSGALGFKGTVPVDPGPAGQGGSGGEGTGGDMMSGGGSGCNVSASGVGGTSGSAALLALLAFVTRRRTSRRS